MPGLKRGAPDPWERKPASTVSAADVAAVQTQVTATTNRFPITSPDIAPLAVTDTKLATDAVTNPKVAPDAMDGETITGAIFQTAASGERVVMRNDGSGGIIEFFGGLSGESPGSIDPNSGGSPRLIISSGTTPALTEASKLTLSAGGVGTSNIQLDAGTVIANAPVSFNDQAIFNGTGSGAGFDTWQVACSSNATATSTTNVTISGFSQSVTSPGTTSVYLVHFDIAWATAAGTSSIIELLVDGTPETVQMTQSTAVLDSLSAHKVWRITGLSEGSHTFTARVRNTAGGTTAVVAQTHSTMTIERKS